MAQNKFKLISADSHVMEPPDIFEKRLPAHLKDRAPKMKDYEGGSAWFVSDDMDPVQLPRSAKTGSGWRLGGTQKGAPISFKDVLPALAAGMGTIRIRRGMHADVESPEGVTTIASLTELPDVLP